MALDGAFLRHIKNEIESIAIGSRIDKIHQPNKEEFVFSFRGKTGTYKLLLSVRANSSRVHFTKNIPENPNVPPMLCMLFRKKLLGAKLIKVRQKNLERVLFLDFEATNELGDKVLLTVVVEIMGKYSNVILIDKNKIIIDALKRVDFLMSSKRQILPTMKYELPPSQDKLNLLDGNIDIIVDKINASVKNDSLANALLNNVQGISPIICREIDYNINNKGTTLCKELEKLSMLIKDNAGSPVIIYENDRPKDFSFINIDQYQNKLTVKKYDCFSVLLDDFFGDRDKIDRMKVKSFDLNKQINNLLGRLRKKIKIQEKEILQSEDKEKFRIFADIINANLYRIEKGVSEVILENFYDKNLEKITIKLNPMLSAAKNAQNFYKSYRKSKVAKEVLEKEIEKAKEEINYLETVLDCLNRAESEHELVEIKNELTMQGYVKERKATPKKQIALSPIEYKLNDKVKILVGRNNHQNDKLTLKIASKNNLWFHVKDIPGSHVILLAEPEDITDEILSKVAQIAAYHSKAKNSSNVPVDYALVKDVKKPNGAKPGKVIYNNYKTLYVTPDIKFIENVSEKGNCQKN